MNSADKGPWYSYSGADLDRIRAARSVARLEFHRELTSTNDRALELAQQGTGYPLLVLAETQTAGRGRAANRWWSSQGALTFSLLLNAHALGLPTNRWPQLSLTVGLAVAEAIEEMGDCAAWLKWPNDVYLQGRKVAGVLVETPPGQRGLLVVGIGLNVNNSVEAAVPEDVRQTAIALGEASDRGPFGLADVLLRVLDRLWELLGWIGARDDELRRRWRQRCLLTNRTVHLQQGARQFAGVCHGIDDEGALILQTANGQQRCFAGVVTRFE